MQTCADTHSCNLTCVSSCCPHRRCSNVSWVAVVTSSASLVPSLSRSLCYGVTSFDRPLSLQEHLLSAAEPAHRGFTDSTQLLLPRLLLFLLLQFLLFLLLLPPPSSSISDLNQSADVPAPSSGQPASQSHPLLPADLLPSANDEPLWQMAAHTQLICVCVCVCVCVCRFRPVQYQDTGPVVKDKHGIRDRLIKNNKTQWTLLNTPPTVMSQQWCHNTLADECLWLLHCLCSLERKSRVTTKLIFTTYYIRRQGPPHINKAKQYKLCCSLFISQWRSFSLILKTCNIS